MSSRIIPQGIHGSIGRWLKKSQIEKDRLNGGTSLDRALELQRAAAVCSVGDQTHSDKGREVVSKMPVWKYHAMCMARFAAGPYTVDFSQEELAVAWLFTTCLKRVHREDGLIPKMAVERLAACLERNYHMLSQGWKQAIPRSALLNNSPAYIPWGESSIAKAMTESARHYIADQAIQKRDKNEFERAMADIKVVEAMLPG